MSKDAMYRYNGRFWVRDHRYLPAIVGQWLVTFKRFARRPWPPASVELFGGRIALSRGSIGAVLDVATPMGRLVYHPRTGRLFLSPNGLPDQATVWFAGAPPEVVEAADERERRRLATLAKIRAEECQEVGEGPAINVRVNAGAGAGADPAEVDRAAREAVASQLAIELERLAVSLPVDWPRPRPLVPAPPRPRRARSPRA